MPWLVGTAFLHSVMVQERRGMLRVWNVALICGAFSLALLGTFLVRSGILESIHAFGASTVGGPLLALIAVVVVGSALLIVSRLDDLRSTKRIESLASRESVFLVNILLLVGLAAADLLGNVLSLISELFTGEKASLAAPWFNRYTTPFAILLVLFTGVGPLLAWRRVSLQALGRLLGGPALAGLATAVALFAFTDDPQLAPGVDRILPRRLHAGGADPGVRAWGGSPPLARWVLLPRALMALFSRNRRRYGGYVVHAGLAILLVAVAASSSFQTSRDLRLRPGQSATVDDYRVTYEKPTAVDRPRRAAPHLWVGARGDQGRGALHDAAPVPQLLRGNGRRGGWRTGASFFEGEATSEVGRKTTAGGICGPPCSPTSVRSIR